LRRRKEKKKLWGVHENDQYLVAIGAVEIRGHERGHSFMNSPIGKRAG